MAVTVAHQGQRKANFFAPTPELCYQRPRLGMEPTTQPVSSGAALRFDRNEIAGAFGDIGTDLPLIIGLILAAGLDSASVLIVYGLMQIGTAVYYRLPMPVQPLKA